MGSIDIEICSKCERAISRSEQAYVFEGSIVCAECDKELRSGPQSQLAAMPEEVITIEPATEEKPQSESISCSKPNEIQERGKYTSNVGKPVGLIIAGVVLCLLGVGFITIGLVGLATSLLLGLPLFGMLIAAGCFSVGLLILILAIAAIVLAVISNRRLLGDRSR